MAELRMTPRERQLDVHFYVQADYMKRFEKIMQDFAASNPRRRVSRGRTLEALINFYEDSQ